MYRNLPVVARKEDDVWIARCLEGDVVTEGPTLSEALDNLLEAVTIVLDDAEEAGIDPFGFRADPEEFSLYERIQTLGEPRESGAEPAASELYATQLRIWVPERSRTQSSAGTPTRVPFGWSSFADEDSVAN